MAKVAICADPILPGLRPGRGCGREYRGAARRARNYQRDGIGPALLAKTGTSLGAGFVLANLLANGVYDADGLDSGSVVVSGTVVLQPGARHTLIAHADGGWIKQALPGQDFDLGLGTGPRAFRSHAFTGDRSFY